MCLLQWDCRGGRFKVVLKILNYVIINLAFHILQSLYACEKLRRESKKGHERIRNWDLFCSYCNVHIQLEKGEGSSHVWALFSLHYWITTDRQDCSPPICNVGTPFQYCPHCNPIPMPTSETLVLHTSWFPSQEGEDWESCFLRGKHNPTSFFMWGTFYRLKKLSCGNQSHISQILNLSNRDT